MSFWSTTVKPMRAELSRRYPKLFAPEGVKDRTKKPLKIGIHQDLFKEFPEVPPKVIRLALFDYIQGPKYLTACYDGATRYDLDGNEAGIVTRDHRLYLLKMEEDNKRRIKRMRNARASKSPKDIISERDIPQDNLTILDV